MPQINDSITETQSISFLLDASKEFNQFPAITLSSYRHVFIFCDAALKQLYENKLRPLIAKQCKVEHVEWIPALETSKEIEYCVHLARLLTEKKCTRSDGVIAIGGGIVLDVVAFLASVFMRGIELIMIPTTLIGQADASTAGKTCINVGKDKNIVGSLYLPKFVYSNVQLLKTTSPHSMRQGFSEIFKYGLLGSSHLLDLLDQYQAVPDPERLLEILTETIRVRMNLRKQHPLVSNFGHTFGHALEKYTGFKVAHGDAISVGMVMALEFSVRKKIMSSELKNHIIRKMTQLHLNTQLEPNISAEQLTEYMLTDKKSTGDAIGLVLIEEIAKPYRKDGLFYQATPAEMRSFLQEFFTLSPYIKSNKWEELRI